MDFDFSPEQYLFQESVRSFLGKRFGASAVPTQVDKDGVGAELKRGLSDLGVFSLLIPEAYGGLGLSLVDLALALEECGRALVPSSIVETVTATDLLVRYATDEQKAHLLPPIACGELAIVPAFLEAHEGYDPHAMRLTAFASNNGWKVSGKKTAVPNAAHADFILVALRIGPSGRLGLALVEPNRRGVSLRPLAAMDLLNEYSEVSFDDVALSLDDLVGGESNADCVGHLFDVGGFAAAMQLVGIASKVLDISIGYARQRTQFGSPIGSFQAIKHRCADMAVKVDASRSAAYYAAWAVANTSDSARAVSIAKSYCGDSAQSICKDGIQIHGGVGFTWDLGLHHYLRRAIALEYSYGDASFHRERLLTRSLADLRAEAQT